MANRSDRDRTDHRADHRTDLGKEDHRTDHGTDLGEARGSRGDFDPAGDTDDTVTEEQLDRLESLVGPADEDGNKRGRRVDRDPGLERELDKLAASSEEEVDALRVNLTQGDDDPPSRDGSGRIVDELAEERMAGLTEVGNDLADKGVVSATPGRYDTSRVLRGHHANTEAAARAEDVGNLDEPRDEVIGERRVDEGTAA